MLGQVLSMSTLRPSKKARKQVRELREDRQVGHGQLAADRVARAVPGLAEDLLDAADDNRGGALGHHGPARGLLLRLLEPPAGPVDKARQVLDGVHDLVDVSRGDVVSRVEAGLLGDEAHHRWAWPRTLPSASVRKGSEFHLV